MIPASRHHVIIPAAGSSRRLGDLTAGQPKSLLRVGGKRIIEHSLDLLDARHCSMVTFVVGYQRQQLMSALGRCRGGLQLNYVVSEDYDQTEHGWSLYLARDAWRRRRSPVLFMDADNLYHPRLLDMALETPYENTCLVDASLRAPDRDEELVLGANNAITALKRGRTGDFPDLVGGFVGINRFSSSFMAALFDFMDRFFETHDRMHKYERIFDAFVNSTDVALNYCSTQGLPWININHPADLDAAAAIAQTMVEGRDVARSVDGASE